MHTHVGGFLVNESPIDERRKGGVRAFFLQPGLQMPDPASGLDAPGSSSEVPTNDPRALEQKAACAPNNVILRLGSGSGSNAELPILPMKLKDIKTACPDCISYTDIRFVLLAMQQSHEVTA